MAAAAITMALHVLGALVWSGALAALLLVRLSTDGLAAAVRRYGRAAPLLALAVGLSGLLTGGAVLGQPSLWWRTDYGRLVLLEAVALAVLVFLGWRHRRRTLPALAAGRAGAFCRIAVVELVVLAATFGLAVGFSRTLDRALEARLVEFDAAAAASAQVPW